MYKYLLLILLVSGCSQDGTKVETKENIADFEVVKLFKTDGCTVYRFYDGGNKHYFTNCGQTMSNVSCGKNSHREEEIGGK